ncbi:hypothetical protein PG997_000413 [Apiospora hydei]|uniref:Uncharacterized protein n=1 Tax=Apiospora hydei TaxID=1337664 RepID=A0ABR1XAN2_9PEZI
MDQCDWVAALGVCFQIVGHSRLESSSPEPRYHDECAVMTMEDIAKSCECAGNIHHAIAWLKQASVSGGIVWGQSETLAHVHDKLRELLKQAGMYEELEIWAPSADSSESRNAMSGGS